MTHVLPSFLSPLQLTLGNIVHQQVDAIVNAANEQLAGGGGVDGAIHNACGWNALQVELRERYPKGCPTGSAVITGAGALAANGVKHIIHAVGPMWWDGERGEREQLASAYEACLALARDHRCRSMAFPSISTGVYDFPLELAAPIALKTVADFLSHDPVFDRIQFVLFDMQTFTAYQNALAALRVHG